MKKFLKFIGISVLLVVVIIGGWIIYQTGLLDTRFWKNNPSIYTDAANGVYECPADLASGSYVLEVRSKRATGPVDIYPSYEAYKSYKDAEILWVRSGSDLHFSISEGQVIEINIGESGKMRFKKVS